MSKLNIPAAIASSLLASLLASTFAFAAPPAKQDAPPPAADPDHQVFTIHDSRPSAEGIVTQIRCTGNVMQLTLKVQGQPAPLLFHAKDLTRVAYSSDTAALKGDLAPCTDLKGRTVKITYTATESKTIKGELARVEVTK